MYRKSFTDSQQGDNCLFMINCCSTSQANFIVLKGYITVLFVRKKQIFVNNDTTNVLSCTYYSTSSHVLTLVILLKNLEKYTTSPIFSDIIVATEHKFRNY